VRTEIDLTEDDSPSGGPVFPSPSSVTLVDDDVVISLCGIEIRMTDCQLYEFSEAINRFVFRDMRGTVKVEDEDFYPFEEHQKLRDVVRAMLNGLIEGCEVSDDVQRAIRASMATRKMSTRLESAIERERRLVMDAEGLRRRVAELEAAAEARLKGRKPKLVRP
jgi:hypothetical protein